MTSTNTIENDPFVNNPIEGEDTTISAEDMIKLLDSLKLDTSDVELQALLERAKKGEAIERDALMEIVSGLLSNVEELDGTMDDFEFVMH